MRLLWLIKTLEIWKRGNFRCTSSSVGVQSQLGVLSSIVKTIDPKLHEHLGMTSTSISRTDGFNSSILLQNPFHVKFMVFSCLADLRKVSQKWGLNSFFSFEGSKHCHKHVVKDDNQNFSYKSISHAHLHL